MTKEEGTPVRLASRDWLSLLGIVAGAAIVNITSMNNVAGDLQTQMIELDRRWQARTEALGKELRSDIKRIEVGLIADHGERLTRVEAKLETLPPEQIERNRQAIERLREQQRKSAALP